MEKIQIQPLAQNGAHHSHKDFSLVKKIGLGVFTAALVVFMLTLGLGDYHVSQSALASIENKVPAERLALLSPLLDQSFDSKFTLINKIDELLRQNQNLSDYDIGVAKFWVLKASSTGALRNNAFLFFLLSIMLGVVGGLMYIVPQLKEGQPGIKHDGIFKSGTLNRGLIGIVLGVLLIGFYVFLYWYPEYITNFVLLIDPVSEAFRNQPADQWFLYGLLYTIAILVMGVRMFAKYRHSRYHLVRTTSVMFFQTGFAFLIPTILERMNQPTMDFKNAWPLDYTLFTDWRIDGYLNAGAIGTFMIVWGVLLAVVGVPLMTYFFGKRWYCSWVCGCGGLAETLGDPWRQLSDKSLNAWRVERILIHAVLVFALVMTVMQIANYASDGAVFSNYTWRVNQWYSFLIGAAFAGVVGVGFYPFMGSRVWCRFGCPLAAILGIFQKFKSRFRITTNGGQCISCGNCSTYCEMGIDVRWYAQRGQNIIRASCVGCGVCAAVCPRGVLSLENGPEDNRYDIVRLASQTK
mgnify:CR=1 FL=1